MQLKPTLIYFVAFFLITSCSIRHQDNSFGVKIIEEQSSVIINSYSTLDEPSAAEQSSFVVYSKNNDFFNINIISSNASCDGFQLDKMKNFFDKVTDNKPSLIRLKHAVNLNLLPFSKFNNKVTLGKDQKAIDFYFPLPKCDDVDRLITIYYLMIHELKHVDLILTGEDKNIDILDNEYIATKSSNCTLITNKHFKSVNIFEVTDTDLEDLVAYKKNSIGNPSQLGAMNFYYEASKISGVGVIKRGTEQHDKLIRWCDE